jgi:hypothetical protein
MLHHFDLHVTRSQGEWRLRGVESFREVKAAGPDSALGPARSMGIGQGLRRGPGALLLFKLLIDPQRRMKRSDGGY